MSAPANAHTQLVDTRLAFDSVAADYDGPLGNNALIQRMRAALWRAVNRAQPPGARLLDLGCGTGLDAAHLAGQGYEVVAIDWSPQMAQRTRARVAQAGLESRVAVHAIGIQELDRLSGEQFDGIYSDLGPLNCVPDLPAVSRACAALLKPGGKLIASVIGRLCPWEMAYYTLQGDGARARIRWEPSLVPVGLNRHTVWTRYYTPREFYRAFETDFNLAGYRALGLFMPPPYLIRLYERLRPLFALPGWIDDHGGGLPLLRNAGDHFLMVLARHG